MSDQVCDVRAAVKTIQAEKDPVAAFPQSQDIAKRALGISDEYFDTSVGVVAHAQSRSHRVKISVLAGSVVFALTVVPAAFLLWGAAVAPAIILVFMLLLFVIFPTGGAIGERFGDKEGVLLMLRRASSFRWTAANALKRGCDEASVREAAIAADGDPWMFDEIVEAMMAQRM